MFGHRPEGRRVRDVDPIVQITPYLMPMRCDAQVFLDYDVEYEPLMRYIAKKSREGVKITFMEILIASFVRGVSQVPEVNRFIMNKQFYNRRELTASFTLLMDTDDGSIEENTVKIFFDPTDTIYDVSARVKELVAKNRKAETSGFAVKLASAVLLTTSRALAEAVDREIIRQTGYPTRSEIMEASLRDFGCAIVCDTLEDCAALANEIAPEHLEIMTENPRALLPRIKNAGAVFLGAWSPEPLGDYLAGPDHVLPTSGTARFFSPLSVDSFLKTMSIIQYDKASLEPIRNDIIRLAEAEHLTAHANSIRVRFEDVDGPADKGEGRA